MAKKRYRLKTECPECGCGLICNMTPDQFREKYGDIKDKTSIDWTECGKDHPFRTSAKNTNALKGHNP